MVTCIRNLNVEELGNKITFDDLKQLKELEIDGKTYILPKAKVKKEKDGTETVIWKINKKIGGTV